MDAPKFLTKAQERQSGMLTYILYSFFSAPALPAPAISWQDQILTDVRALYEPYAKTESKTLVLRVGGDEKSLSASAVPIDGGAEVVLEKGVMDSPRLTPDSLRLTLCHELGHIFGGAPRRYNPVDWDGPAAEDGMSVMSAEGQADYYAAMVCFRQLIRGQDHQQVLATAKVPPEVKETCEKAWGDDLEGSLICQRTLVGAFSFLNFVMDFRISFSTPDTSIPEKLDRGSYPLRQCRLDTFVAGARCNEKHDLQLDFMDPAKSECAQTEAQRPRCWYPR